MNDNLVNEFERLLFSTKRPGIEKLVEYIRKTDFYTAPASTKYHGCHEGGLLEHSLNVYKCLMAKKNSETWREVFQNITDENIIITALLHDLCKTNFYVVEMKNKKVYSETGTKMDSNGRYDWVSVPGYSIEDKNPMGHGEKSVIMIMNFIKLVSNETYGILFHMGFTLPKEEWNTLSAAIQKHPFILAVHEADLEATYLLEKEE
jgi:hypothetical protein